jgi:hypothetical protein
MNRSIKCAWKYIINQTIDPQLLIHAVNWQRMTWSQQGKEMSIKLWYNYLVWEIKGSAERNSQVTRLRQNQYTNIYVVLKKSLSLFAAFPALHNTTFLWQTASTFRDETSTFICARIKQLLQKTISILPVLNLPSKCTEKRHITSSIRLPQWRK